MGLLFLDSTNAYSDPTQTGRTYLRADYRWAPPDSEHLFLSARREWEAMELFTPPDNIATASWADIERLSALAAKNPQSYMRYLGQTVVLGMSSLGNGCANVTAMVIGVGQDVDPQGHKLGLTFQLRDGLPYQMMRMNSSNTTTGGWRDSLMRSNSIQTVKNALPTELRARLKTMAKKTHITGSHNQLVETQDDLALLSQVEVFGNEDPAGEGEQYQWYAQHNANGDRIIHCADGPAKDWWLRSVYGPVSFYFISNNGVSGNGVATNQCLPCACFCV